MGRFGKTIYTVPRTTDAKWRHKSKISEKLGQCGKHNIFRQYLKIWDWDWIFGITVKAISSQGVRSPCTVQLISVPDQPGRIQMHYWILKTNSWLSWYIYCGWQSKCTDFQGQFNLHFHLHSEFKHSSKEAILQ